MDDAIDKALVFLQRTQDKTDGSWTAGRGGKNAAVTGLAVMAFLSAGHVPGEGRYRETVEKGIRWVLQQQQANGLIATEGGHEMYHHGICTLMLAEVAGMTEGKLAQEVKQKLEKAVAVVLKAQRQGQRDGDPFRGGWRYQVHGYDSDISVTGWQLLALRAVKNLGCDVPPERIERAIGFLKRCQDPTTGGFCYLPGAHPTVACTGTCIVGLEVCGKAQHRSDEAVKGAAYLIKHPPQWAAQDYHLFYSLYYGSQAMFQLGGNYWNTYRKHLHQALLPNQSNNGSWQGPDGDSQYVGPNYCTAMGVLALAVEYRYLPIYQSAEEPAEKEK
jgi:hypothetical protein